MSLEQWRAIPAGALVKDEIPTDTGYELLPNYRIRRTKHPVGPKKVIARLYDGVSKTIEADYHSFDLETPEWTPSSNYNLYETKMGKIRNRETKELVTIFVDLTVCGKSRNYDLDLLVENTFNYDRYLSNRVEELKLLYPGYSDFFPLIYLVPPSRRDDLLVISHPTLIPSWDDDPKLLMKTFRCSQKPVKWKCALHTEKYKASPAAVTSNQRSAPACPGCRLTGEELSDMARRNIEQGAAIEQHIVGLLRERQDVEHVEWTGQQSNSRDDLLLKMKDNPNLYPVQVKKLSQRGVSTSYYFNLPKGYDAKMPLVACNDAKSHWIVGHCGDFTTRCVTFSFTPRAKTYKVNKFTSVEQALSKLISLLPTSVLFENMKNRFNATNLLEYESVNRFRAKCEQRETRVENPPDNGTVVDLIVNGNRVQMKFVSEIQAGKSQYSITITRCNGTGSKNRTPYAASDNLQFFIFEVGGNKGHFMIIPILAMIDRGFIKTSTQPGKTSTSIYPPDSLATNQWSQYWDRFDLLIPVS